MGKIIKEETNSKGQKVIWHRLPSDIKDDATKVTTSTQNVEYAVQRPMVDIEQFGRFIADNANLQNVSDFVIELFDVTNRRLIQEAGAGGLSEVKLIADVESLIFYATSESARGRKATRFNPDQWKIFSPIFTLHAYNVYRGRGDDETLAKKKASDMNGFARIALSQNAPMDLKLLKAIGKMLDESFMRIIEEKPEHESLWAFGVAIVEGLIKVQEGLEDMEY